MTLPKPKHTGVCPTCGLPIQPGQLYLAASGRHVGCKDTGWLGHREHKHAVPYDPQATILHNEAVARRQAVQA